MTTYESPMEGDTLERSPVMIQRDENSYVYIWGYYELPVMLMCLDWKDESEVYEIKQTGMKKNTVKDFTAMCH